MRAWRPCRLPDLLSRVDAQLARAGRTGALRQALDSAWSSLPDPARRLWERLSVFAGPVDLDAVEQVCADDTALPEEEVVDALTALVAGSVVLLERTGTTAGRRTGCCAACASTATSG